MAEESSDIISTWYLPNCSRADAELLLHGTPSGTFLVRAKSNGLHALSIVCNYTVYHCLIFQSEDLRFGFGTAEPYKMFNTLSELVIYYTSNSLFDLCCALPTELLHPVNSNLIKLMRHYSLPDN